MNNVLLFDFTVDKATNTILVTREFNAELPLVWKAWTTAELLEKWGSPHPFTIETRSFNFSEGRAWHYAMVSPEQEKHWCRFDYETIEALKSYTGRDAFCDEEGIVNPDFSRMHWTNSFQTEDSKTKVSIVIKVDTWETIEKIIAMGFKEGFTMCLQQLEILLPTLK